MAQSSLELASEICKGITDSKYRELATDLVHKSIKKWGHPRNNISPYFISKSFEILNDSPQLMGILYESNLRFISDTKNGADPMQTAKALKLCVDNENVFKHLAEYIREKGGATEDVAEALMLLKDEEKILGHVANFLINNKWCGSAIGIAQSYILSSDNEQTLSELGRALSGFDESIRTVGNSSTALNVALRHVFKKALGKHKSLKELEARNNPYSNAILKCIGMTFGKKSSIYLNEENLNELMRGDVSVLSEGGQDIVHLLELLDAEGYKTVLLNGPESTELHQTLKKYGIERWDDSSYEKAYHSKYDGNKAAKLGDGKEFFEGSKNLLNEIFYGRMKTCINAEKYMSADELKPPEEACIQTLTQKRNGVRQKIKEHTGRNEAPPKELLDEMNELTGRIKQETSVYQSRLAKTRNSKIQEITGEIKERHGGIIKSLEDGNAKREQVIYLLDTLKNEYLHHGSEAYKKIEDVLLLSKDSEHVSGDIKARIWQRDPWTDLSYGEEFYCCTVVDGLHWKAAINHLETPSVSALDIHSDKLGRCIRVYLMASVGKEPLLLVDGVEGTDRIKPEIVKQAIEDYATAAGFKKIVYNKRVGNSTPKKFVEYVNQLYDYGKIMVSIPSTKENYVEALGGRMTPVDSKIQGAVNGYVVEM